MSTIVDDHLHGPLAEVVFLLRAKERQVVTLESIIQQQAEANRKLAEWNKYYFHLLYGDDAPSQLINYDNQE